MKYVRHFVAAMDESLGQGQGYGQGQGHGHHKTVTNKLSIMETNTQQPDKTVQEKNKQSGVWVNCSDRLPDNSRDVFCKDEKGHKYVAYYGTGAGVIYAYGKVGWCEEIDYCGCKIYSRNIVEWLDESQPFEPSIPISRVAELLAMYDGDDWNEYYIAKYPKQWEKSVKQAEEWLTNNNK